MRIGAFTVSDPLPELREPHAFAMLQPWIDVGSVGTMTITWLESCVDAITVAKITKPGDFFDFTRYRPTIFYRDGKREVAVPNTFATYGRSKKGDDYLFLHLLEPHNRAESYIQSVFKLLHTLGVKRYCQVGSMYDMVPHTRPLIVTGRADGKGAEDELRKLGIESSTYEGPTSITYLISQSAARAGIETMSLIVHLPQYTQVEEDYTGTARLMRIISSIYGLGVDARCFEHAEQQLEEIRLAMEKNAQLKGIVEQLESYYESRTQAKKEAALSPEIERFLKEMERRFRESNS